MAQSRILIIEDNHDNLELMRFLLERAGHAVLTGQNGREAIEVARRELPDLILMDLSLPEIDGWTAASLIKTDPQTAHIPLLAITAHTLPGDRKRALESGFNGYISKPINMKLFSEAVDRALKIKPAK
jgi:two-component system cell cycle response regulator DivK